ncbi:MAG: PAS domain-containing protein, partial [Deltaproteobacteria bacterium]|nr:PAS domain-containing protein [Deltaproteobacteria bacterium]
INKTAVQMLGVKTEQVLGKNYGEAFQSEPLRVVREIIQHVRGRASVEREVKIMLPDQILTVVATAATLRGDEGNILGIMVFLEDITQIQKVQRMEAWREVARRIAHEIKNPLTPIQLSAERLRKRYAKLLEGNGAILDKCTSTIIKQVEELKNLVNECSQFARLPAAELTPNDLNEIVKEALFLFKEGHRGIDFQFQREELPPLELDRDQIKVEEKGEIKISTVYNSSSGIVQLEVADDGCGLAPEVRARVFEPYFSTKKDGTGLGLAIVSAIVADHRGYIRVRPNEPKGTRFIIELPVPDQTDFQEIRRKAAYS